MLTGTVDLRLRTLIALFIVGSQDGIQATDRILLHTWQHMRIHIHCHADLRVTEQLLNHFRVRPHTQQHRCCTMLTLTRFRRAFTDKS